MEATQGNLPAELPCYTSAHFACFTGQHCDALGGCGACQAQALAHCVCQARHDSPLSCLGHIEEGPSGWFCVHAALAAATEAWRVCSKAVDGEATLGL